MVFKDRSNEQAVFILDTHAGAGNFLPRIHVDVLRRNIPGLCLLQPNNLGSCLVAFL